MIFKYVKEIQTNIKFSWYSHAQSMIWFANKSVQHLYVVGVSTPKINILLGGLDCSNLLRFRSITKRRNLESTVISSICNDFAHSLGPPFFQIIRGSLITIINQTEHKNNLRNHRNVYEAENYGDVFKLLSGQIFCLYDCCFSTVLQALCSVYM